MQKFNLVQILLLVFLINSCAWNKEKIGKVETAGDLVDSFDLSKQDLDKFKTAPAEKKVVVNKKEEKVVAEKPTIKTEKKDKSKKAKTEEAPAEEYPEAFVKYDNKARKVWSEHKPKVFINEKMKFDIKFFGITAGKISIKTLPVKKVGDHSTFHFYARLLSAPFYRYIYELDDYIESFVTTEKFLPVKYTLVQRESAQAVDDLQVFDNENNKTHYWYKRVKKDRNKKENKQGDIPKFFQDSFSALFFVRGLPLNIGDVYEFPIITRAKVWILKMKIEKIENIEVMDKTVKAIKIAAETRFPGVLKKRGAISFWYSADEKKKLLKFEAKVKIGAIRGELVEYSAGKGTI